MKNNQWSRLVAGSKILLLGSGGLSIGQAGEFDYSGTQAVHSLLEEGYEVIVVNPNIATVQTQPIENVRVYLYPVEPDWVTKVIEKERPDAIVAGFGGQTAINCVVGLKKKGILEKYSVRNLGSSIETLILSEDRDDFAKRMDELKIPTPPSRSATTLDGCISAASEIGYPVILRAAFALGGLGSGFANNDEELLELARTALNYSPQVLIEKSLKGWKEVEYEIMRDSFGNRIAICNMENFDPMGIHTGDSIVIAPSQTLTDREYQMLRDTSFRIVDSLEIIGECNVQFSLSPNSEEFYVIETNARLSRSSALASKASGYPIAAIAAKVVCGRNLMELKNPVTGITFAFYEPSLDYVAVKVPRWDLQKFSGVSRDIGSTMKSVGEVMAIGRSFPEVIQKATRMVTESGMGLSKERSEKEKEELLSAIGTATDERLFDVYQGFLAGFSIDEMARVSGIDRWFLRGLEKVYLGQKEISSFRLREQEIQETHFEKWKKLGFSDIQLAGLLDPKSGTQAREQKARELRAMREKHGVGPVFKKIDTTSAEFPSPSNYLYSTYMGQFSDEIDFAKEKKRAIVLGAGPYRIGTSVEFDWCAVSCAETMRKRGWETVIINCNPETVSTDYHSSDYLFFEEISVERILDVYHSLACSGVVVCMGGQHANNLAFELEQSGVKILGHSARSIGRAEDRSQFSNILDSIGVDQPKWIQARSPEEVYEFIDRVGYPVLVRPSFVISGSAMRVVHDRSALESCLSEAWRVSGDSPVVVSEFLSGHREIELDGVAQDGKVVAAVISEHIENAGVHSGDATTVVPGQKLYVETVRRIRKTAAQVVAELQLNGPFNIQFLARSNKIKIIELNARASRSFPFVSKVIGINLAEVASRVLIGEQVSPIAIQEDAIPVVGVKASMFSFHRLNRSDPVLGVEMSSTGEVGCIAENFDRALQLALLSTGLGFPKKGVLVSSGRDREKMEFLRGMEIIGKVNIDIYATGGTAKHLREQGYEVKEAHWPGEGSPDCIDIIRQGLVDLVINVPKTFDPDELRRGYSIRQAAIEQGCSLLTNMEKTIAFLESFEADQQHEPLALSAYRDI